LPSAYLVHHRNSIVGFIGYNVVFGLAQKNTDMAAHAGGLVAGALVGSVLARDLLNPAEHAIRRLFITAGLAAALVLAAFGVRSRTLAVPAIKANRAADAGLDDLRAKRYREAVTHFTEALAVQREFGFLFNRGLAHYGLEDLKAAEADMRDAHALQPGAKTDSMLCEISVTLGGTPEAFEEAANHCTAAAAAAESPTKKAALLSMRAIARGMQSRLAESLADAEEAIGLDPHAVMARAHRASMYLDDERFAEAEQDCEKLLTELEPRAFDLEICARVAHARNDLGAERDRLERRAKLPPP
jgi:tetratricopeptide (TPR) repeat protein